MRHDTRPRTPLGGSPNPRTTDRTLTILGVALSAPQAAVALVELFGGHLTVGPPDSWGPTQILCAAGVTGLAWASTRRLARSVHGSRLLFPLAEWLLASRDQHAARAHTVQQALMTQQFRMLEMDPVEFARRAGLRIWEARFLIANPTFVPRADVATRIRAALMVPLEWPCLSYGPDLTEERLVRHWLNGASATSIADIYEMTVEQREELLRAIEFELELPSSLKGGRRA